MGIGLLLEGVKKCQNLTFKVNFLHQKSSESFRFFPLKDINLGTRLYWHFLITSIFTSLHFLKWYSIFDSLPLHQFSKFNNFLWVCWFLGKYFVPHSWKLDSHNRKCTELTRNNLPFRLPRRKFKLYLKLQNTFLTYEDSIKIFLQIGECPDVFFCQLWKISTLFVPCCTWDVKIMKIWLFSIHWHYMHLVQMIFI